MDKFALPEKFACFDDLWSPKIVAEMNGQYVKLAKGLGELDWHSHEQEDEFFMVVSGHLDIHLRDRVVALDAGDCFVVPRGVEHRPVALRGAEILLIEPRSTLHTGKQQTAQTVAIEDQEWI
ncbi:cupin domain-containing protein [Woeseia oceani]|uniref:Cupin n=1 Tax=Woeseia oceani TaxID=1548547 RepID=A0A193LIY2_9GAMM|nr:cupin domain-containing protein [Woeseia oceani]ANO52403.1 cupin [Woeseia oceani]